VFQLIKEPQRNKLKKNTRSREDRLRKEKLKQKEEITNWFECQRAK